MAGIVSAEQLRIINIRLDSERFNKPLFISNAGESSGIVIEANIYEDLSKPFLTGDIIIQDDQDIYRLADISGTERIIIDFESPDQSGDVITINFIISEVSDNIKYNDFAAVTIFSLVEDVKYLNDLNRFSKAYTGTGEEIIRSILSDKMSRELVVESSVKSSQKTFRYIVPNLNPFSAIKNILRKMTTDTGMPFFLYSAIVDDKFYLTDLETIIQQESFNKDRPFVYDQNNTVKNDIESQAINITSYEANLLDDTLTLAKMGGIGSKYESINATNGQGFEYHIDMSEHFADLVRAELFPKSQNFISFDKEFIADPNGNNPIPITQYNSKITSRIITEPYSGGVNGFNQESYAGQETLYVIRDGVLHHLLKNTYTINLPGLLFSLRNITTCVGHPIKLDIYKNDTSIGSSNKIDQKRSGDYVILAKRHSFDVAGERHNVALKLSRIAQPEIVK